MVIDETGLDLVKELSEGSWSEYKTKLLQEKVFSNSEYKLLREELVKILKNCKEDNQEDTLNGFQAFLCGPSKFRTLKEYMSHGRSLIEAMSVLFQAEYLPDVLIAKKDVTVSSPQTISLISQNSNISLDDIIADPDVHKRMQRLKDLVPVPTMEAYVRKEWKMDPSEKVDPIIEHYCYHLAKNNCKWLNGVRTINENGLQLDDAFIEHFKSAYVRKMRGMKYPEQRDAFFGLIADTDLRDKTLWNNKVVVYNKKIDEEIKNVFENILFHNRVKFTNKGLKCTNSKLENSVLTLLSEEKTQLSNDLKGFLTGASGKELVLKYFYRSSSSLENWVHNMAINFIVSKPRVDHILDDPSLLLQYFRNSQEFYRHISGLCRSFDFTPVRISSLPEENKCDSDDNGNYRPNVATEPDDFISEMMNYLFHFDNGQCRYKKYLETFRFESNLSTFMYRICNNYLKKKKKEVDDIYGIKTINYAETMEKGVFADDNDPVFNPQRFIELYRNYIRDLKNKIVEPLEIVKRTKKSSNNSSAELLVNYLNRTGMPIESAKAEVTNADFIRDFDLLVDSALVGYAWCFLGIRNREIQIAYDKMRASVLKDIHNNKWQFMERQKEDSNFSEIIVWPFWEIRTRISINDLDDIFIQDKLKRFENRLESVIKDCNSFVKKRDTHKDEEEKYVKIKCDVLELLNDVRDVKRFFTNPLNDDIDKDRRELKEEIEEISLFENEVEILAKEIENMNYYKIRDIGSNHSILEEEDFVESIPFFLILYCHLLLARFYQVVMEESLYEYNELKDYYGVDEFNIRKFRERAYEVMRDNVAPFILKMRYELGGDNYMYAPIIINYFQDLIRTIAASTKVVNARNAKMKFMADTIIELLKTNARSKIVDENEGEVSCPDDALQMKESDLPKIRKQLEERLKLYDLRPIIIKCGDKYGVKEINVFGNKGIDTYTQLILDYLKDPILVAMDSQTTEKARIKEMNYLADTIVTMIKEHSGGVIDKTILSNILPLVKEKLKNDMKDGFYLQDLYPVVEEYGKKLGLDIIKYTPDILDYLREPIFSALASQTNEKERTEEIDYLAKTIVILIRKLCGDIINNSVLSTILPSVRMQLKEDLSKRKHNTIHFTI